MAFFSKYLWLIADDPDQAWYCNCRVGIVDAPWHDTTTHPVGGTGWLWTCANCSRAFMFARAVMLRGSLEKIAKKKTPRTQKVISMNGKTDERVLLADSSEWLALTNRLQATIKEGERYVFFDGHAIPAQHGPIKFSGLYRSHDLPDLPHLSESLFNQTLANAEYWVTPE